MSDQSSLLTRRRALQATLAAGMLAQPQAEGQTPSLSPAVLAYGQDQPLPEQIVLTAGPLSMVFEPDLAFLRYIRLGDREVLRGLYAAVRDQSWLTIAPRVSNLRVDTSAAGFRVSFDVICRERDIDYGWHGAITGDPQGTVRFTFDGQARSSFLRNRIGFCILHPVAECAGRPCTVETVSGGREQGRFPDLISPNQPFQHIRAMTHEIEPGVTVEVRAEGDTFEMEDQRNWTDASYKTYCTPLGLAFPVRVKEGDKVQQSVTVRLLAPPAKPAVLRSRSEITFEAGPQTLRLPALGVGWPRDNARLSTRERDRLQAVKLAHLRVDLQLKDESHAAMLEHAAATGLPLEAAVFLSGDAEGQLRTLAASCGRVKPAVARWLVFRDGEVTTTPQWVQLARRYLSSVSPTARFGAGTNVYFTELNRNRPVADAMDVICYSINPQVHAFDNASLVEALQGQAYTVQSARAFCGTRPLAVTPVTLRPRFNPQASGPDTDQPGKLPYRVDPRQMSLFGAGWTLGSIKYLAESGAQSVTYYETTGWGGLMEREGGSPLPDQFRSLPGTVFPLYHVLADVAGFAPAAGVVLSRSSEPLAVDGLVLRGANATRVMLANYTPRPQAVRVVKAGLGRRVRVRYLHQRTALQAMKSPEQFRADPGRLMEVDGSEVEILLLPYAVARVDAVS